MSYRYMRMLVFFDLPTLTYIDQKEYRLFRKFLINDGFIMMQESVYCKLALNNSIMKAEMKRLRDNKPKSGDVEVLIITEKQFASIEYLCGSKQKLKEDSDERLIVL